MSVAVSMAKHFGVEALAVPSAGNAAGALAAYAALAGIPAHLFMPSDTPKATVIECTAIGALGTDDKVVIFNTGTGLKYLECFPGSAGVTKIHAADDRY